ncbi:MAG: hypothetical protein DRJ50_01895 [Actinobacteria bacterium]|nr:MAG: hypothetical protein DRJ50_01895 [Actinomycetota bacterium]
MVDVSTAKVTVTPTEFHFVKYEAQDIIDVVTELAELLGVANPIHVIVDETTPLSKLASEADGTSSDSTLTLRAESGALENTKRFTHFSAEAARGSLGRTLLRAKDRLRDDFADAPGDYDLTLAENAAWDTYCAGRLSRMGVELNKQRWRYNYRNRFGFSDDCDAAFEQLWSADGLSWAELAAER